MKRPTVGSEETIVPISLLNKQVSKVVISLVFDNVRSLRQITLNSCCVVQNTYAQVETGLNSPSSATVVPGWRRLQPLVSLTTRCRELPRCRVCGLRAKGGPERRPHNCGLG